MNNEPILVRSYASNFDQICNFQMIPKNSITHLIYWKMKMIFYLGILI